jgi:hypothetical protein
MDDTKIREFLRNPSNYFTVAECAAKIAEPGISTDTCASQIRGFQQRRLIHPVDKRGSGRTASFLYDYKAAASAKLFSLLTSDHSIADNEILSIVSGHLYGWSDHNPSNDCGWPCSIEAALAGTLKGKYWVFRLDIFRSDQTGQRDFRVYVYDMDKGLPKTDAAPDMMPRGSVTLPLFAPFMRLLSDRSKAN